MMANGLMINQEIKDKSLMQTKINMKAILTMGKNLEKEFIITIQEENIKENGTRTKRMGTE